jgi:transcriptional regulator with XRE-family HTH domain
MARNIKKFGDPELLALGKLLRQLREQRGWSLKQLATQSGISVAAIQKIEAGEANPGFVTVAAITEALGTSIDQIISAARTEARFVSVLSGHIPDSGDAGADGRDLSEQLSDARLAVRLLTLPPRSDLAADATPEIGPLFAYVIGGALRLTFSDDTVEELKTGDAIHIKDDMPAAWSNPNVRPTMVLCVTDREPAGQ